MAIQDATRKPARPVPTTGMRGGLGRTLLTAFLVLAIGPLSLVGYLAFVYVRGTQQKYAQDRQIVVTNLSDTQFENWAQERANRLAAVSAGLETSALAAWLRAHPEAASVPLAAFTQSGYQDFESLWLQDAHGQQMWAVEGALPQQTSFSPPVQALDAPRTELVVEPGGRVRLSCAAPVAGARQIEFYLVSANDVPAQFLRRIAEQSSASAQEASDQFAAGLIATILAVALLTAVIAAVVTRQITRPIVCLTEVALRMADGDLSQRVQVSQRDEIGILARVFNKMAGDLGELYAGLEKKVAERTRELEEAKAQIQYHAWQLSISAEVGRITTSILDLDTLLGKAAALIRDAFQLDHAGIYLLDGASDIAILRKNAGRAVPDYERQVRLGGTHPVSWAISQRMLRTTIKPSSSQDARQTPRQELVLPLALGAKVIGALDLTSYDPAGFSETDQDVLQALADQLTVAIENARAYGREHSIADEMREVDRLRGQFLERMSHQMATYLNNIIGFSQVLLKGIDGPLTDVQTKDLAIIRQSGQQLLQLLNNILDLANLEAGAVEMYYAPVNLSLLLDEFHAALAPTMINPQIYVDIQAEANLPTVLADAHRLRQVLTNLVITAMEIAREGAITLQVARTEEQVHFVISTPITNAALWTANSHSDISLALSRRLIELHGGRLRVAQDASGQSVFAFHLPIHFKPLQEPQTTWEVSV